MPRSSMPDAQAERACQVGQQKRRDIAHIYGYKLHMKHLALVFALTFTGCAGTYVRDGNGKLRLALNGTNAQHVAYRGSDGTTLEITGLDNSTSTGIISKGISQGITAGGAAVATSGILGVLK